jgi:hypothetical protein
MNPRTKRIGGHNILVGKTYRVKTWRLQNESDKTYRIQTILATKPICTRAYGLGSQPHPTLLAPRPTPPGLQRSTPRQDAVTSDTMCNWELIQCAAAMRVIRVANTSSDSKVTAAGHQMPSIPPADSPFRSRSYVTFVTDQELRQARADLEECFCRRARRAGLEESLPAVNEGEAEAG